MQQSCVTTPGAVLQEVVSFSEAGWHSPDAWCTFHSGGCLLAIQASLQRAASLGGYTALSGLCCSSDAGDKLGFTSSRWGGLGLLWPVGRAGVCLGDQEQGGARVSAAFPVTEAHRARCVSSGPPQEEFAGPGSEQDWEPGLGRACLLGLLCCFSLPPVAPGSSSGFPSTRKVPSPHVGASGSQLCPWPVGVPAMTWEAVTPTQSALTVLKGFPRTLA